MPKVFIAVFLLSQIIMPTFAFSDDAYFAGGCFWCMESDLEKLDGVEEVISGYSDGSEETANYEKVSSGSTEHFEAVKVTYDPNKISYADLIDRYVHLVDPYDAEGQFCDRGLQYRAAIFPSNAREREAVQSTLESYEKKLAKGDILIMIRPFKTFFPAEDYHQGYYKKNPIRYKFYRSRCGRNSRLEEVWGSE